MRLVFLGNCQLLSLSKMYETFVVPHTGDHCVFIDIMHTLTEDEHSLIRSADVLVQQVYDLAPGNEFEHPGGNAKCHYVPVVSGAFLWPFAGTPHPDSYPRYGDYDPFRAEMSDTYLLAMLEQGIAPDEAVNQYEQIDVNSLTNLDRRYELIIEKQRQRDVVTGYAVAQLIESRFRDEKLFLTPYHLGLRLARYIALCFLHDLGIATSIVERVERFMTNSYHFQFELPIHPSVARHFGLQYANSETLYRFYEEGYITFRHFAHKFVRCDANIELHKSIMAVNTRQQDARQLIEQAYSKAPESPFVANALAKTLIEEGRFAEAIPILRLAISMRPDIVYAHLLLSDCLFAMGQADEAIFELRKEVALQPFNANVQGRFAYVLADSGHLGEAIEAAGVATELDPRDQNTRSFLDELLKRRDVQESVT